MSYDTLTDIEASKALEAKLNTFERGFHDRNS